MGTDWTSLINIGTGLDVRTHKGIVNLTQEKPRRESDKMNRRSSSSQLTKVMTPVTLTKSLGGTHSSSLCMKTADSIFCS